MSQKGRISVDQKLVLALVCGASLESAARQAGISERTAYRRKRNPAFQAQLRAARQEIVQRTATMLTAAATESVKTLLRLQGDGIPYAVQLGAAKAIIDLGARLREHSELYDRVAAIEERLTVQL
jgi:hypothetical protein